MKKISFYFFLLFSITLQAQQWVNCTSGHFVNDALFHNGILWTATTGGLVKDNLSGNVPQFFNRGNSPIPSNYIQSLAMDSDENLWLTTNNGTAIFDGNNWQIFYEKSGFLQLDNEGKMVIAETDSLHWWDGQSFESIVIPNGFFFTITDFEIDHSTGDLWTTYYGFGQYSVYKYDGVEFTTYDYQNSNLPFESATFNPLILDSQNRVLAGTSSGLFRLENNLWSSLSDEIAGFPKGYISALDRDEDGNIWIGINSEWPAIEGHLVKMTSEDEIEFYTLPNAFSDKPILQTIEVIKEPSTTIFAGSPRFGLWEFDLTNWTKVRTDQSLAQSNNITQIFVDGLSTFLQSGNDLSNDKNSLFSIKEGDWLYYNADNLPFSIHETYPPTVVTQGPNDTLWLHTGDSLFAYKNEEWYFPKFPDILDDVEEINSFIHFEPDGKRWLLDRWASYIFHETDQGWEVFEHEEHGASSGAYVSYFTHPQTGDFWLASANGISRYDGQDWTLFEPQSLGLGTSYFRDMEVDENGVVWANTYQAVFRIENNIPEIFAEEIPGYPNTHFGGLTLDQEGRVWVGIGSAISFFNGTNWQIFDNKNSGVPNGLIMELEFDDLGNLWVGSQQGGFSVYNPDGLPDYLLDDFHTSISDSLDQESPHFISVFPNPIAKNSVLKIHIPHSFNINNKTSFQFFDSLGRVVKSGQIWKYRQDISIDSIKVTGTYFLKISNGAQEIIEKVVVY